MSSWSRSQASQASPHAQLEEILRVLATITEILTDSNEIIQGLGDKRGNSCISTVTLNRVFALWEEIIMMSHLSIMIILLFLEPLKIYKSILDDIRHDPVEISDDTINRRLDDFRLHWQEALDRLKHHTGQRSSMNSAHFFQNSHHFTISGGKFIAITSSPDPVVREQSHKILQAIYIQIVITVLFA